jgi:2-C-methyl-D-erythritol 4-phosphate cytidylyltransferase
MIIPQKKSEMGTVRSTALILAGGSGSRMNTDLPKQYIQINSRTVLAYTLDPFQSSSNIDSIVIAASSEYHSLIEKIVSGENFSKVKKIILGGTTRQESSYNGVVSLQDNPPDIVFIHDAARPFISNSLFVKLIEQALEYGGASTAVKSTDTVYITENGCVTKIPQRDLLYNAQTPQVFRYRDILEAHKNARGKNKKNLSDDAGLLLEYGGTVKIVHGEYKNIKLTTPEDLELAKRMLGSNIVQ